MEEEIIRITIDEVISEIKTTNVSDFEGLCYYCSNNVMFYLLEQGIESKMCNIKDYINIDYDHYFLIADNKYLIDLTYSQFLPKNEKLRFFSDYPASVLSSSSAGENILNHLINDYYVKLENDTLNLYLSSFKKIEKMR